MEKCLNHIKVELFPHKKSQSEYNEIDLTFAKANLKQTVEYNFM